MTSLKDQVAFVFAATGAIAKVFAENGAKVYVFGKSILIENSSVICKRTKQQPHKKYL